MKQTLSSIFLIVLLSCFVIPVTSHAQIVISGHVEDTDGNPICGASVYCKNCGQTIATDTDGNFLFLQNHIGHTLTITCIGYQSVDVVCTAPSITVVLTADTL